MRPGTNLVLGHGARDRGLGLHEKAEAIQPVRSQQDPEEKDALLDAKGAHWRIDGRPPRHSVVPRR
jgi:hypothetical protein